MSLCLPCNSNHSASSPSRTVCTCTSIILQDPSNRPSPESPPDVLFSDYNLSSIFYQDPSPFLVPYLSPYPYPSPLSPLSSPSFSSLSHASLSSYAISDTYDFSYQTLVLTLGLPLRAMDQPVGNGYTMRFGVNGLCSKTRLSSAALMDDVEFLQGAESLTRCFQEVLCKSY